MTSRIQPKSGVYSVSKADFEKAFEDVPKVAITSAIDLRNKFETVKTILSNSSEDWNKRQNQLKTVRSLIINGEKLVDRSTMIGHVLQLLGCFEMGVKDLRSQILREAAITCSFIISKYGIETHSIGEDILIPTMSQVAVSTKIMATSASTLTEFIVEYIQTRQVFTILSSFSTSKDKNQRRQLAVLLEIIIGKWSDRIKKQIMRQICELVKSAINDADSETRASGRKAFAKLEEFHPDEADILYSELEHSKQKMLRGGDAASSWASVNSDKGSIPIRSKLSAGSKAHSNISATKIPYPNRPGSRTRTSSITSNDSRDTSPTRRHSPLPPDNQKARVKYGNGSFFAKLGMPENTDDDEFLLPIRIRSPLKTNLGDYQDNVSRVLKECCSSSVTEKKEGIKKLLPVVADTSLNSQEIKNIGNCLNRLLSDATNSMVFDIYSVFIRTHNSRLSEWLRLALAKLFARKAAEALPNTKKQIGHTLNVILECFNAHHQLITVCELMCDPIHLMVPKAKVALLEYMTSLLDEYTDPGASINIKELKAAIQKMLTWVSDPRQSTLLTPYVEKAICSMFCVNVADFSALISDFDQDQKNWIHQTLQRNGLENGISGGAPGNNYHQPREVLSPRHRNESASIVPEFKAHKRPVVNLGSFNTSNNSAISKLEEQSTSRLMEKINLNSTVTLPPDTLEKIQSVQDLLHKMRNSENSEEQEAAISSIYMKICDGGFGIWEQCYAKLLLNLFEILSTSKNENNKKMCLRILGKMCTAQAAKLFDSTEMAVCKVLDAAVNTNDATTALAVDDCLRTLATHLPLSNIINIAKVILMQEPIDDERASLVLKMVTRLFEELPAEELKNVVDDITPSVIKAYQSTSSSVRKTVVYCLVAMVNRVGEQRMAPHFTKLPKALTNLIQVYVNRAISTSLPRL
ncbi:CBN-CLS-3 protein [Caenorhabditis brenneri]|uniref:CBN-CLS-3 protein n=1 Tax=Caenorhabditis brenneri TaxID=135651 RepID=G0MJX0_CAEBE|nr:CBN-CLS-3 protein [Caenorhabditis brenneri]